MVQYILAKAKQSLDQVTTTHMTYQEIIQKNIKEMPFLYCNAEVDVEQWHTQSLISYLKEENKRLEESKYDDWDGADNIDVGFNRAINEQVEHNKNVIEHLKEL